MEVGKKIFQTVHKVCVLINVTLPVWEDRWKRKSIQGREKHERRGKSLLIRRSRKEKDVKEGKMERWFLKHHLHFPITYYFSKLFLYKTQLDQIHMY